MSRKKSTAKIPFKWLSLKSLLGPDNLGRIMLGVVEWEATGKEPDYKSDLNLMIAWTLMREDIDAMDKYQAEKTAEKAEKAAAKAAKNAEKAATKDPDSEPDPDPDPEVDPDLEPLPDFVKADLDKIRNAWNACLVTQPINTIGINSRRCAALRKLQQQVDFPEILRVIRGLDGQAAFRKWREEGNPLKFDQFLHPEIFGKIREGAYEKGFGAKEATAAKNKFSNFDERVYEDEFFAALESNRN